MDSTITFIWYAFIHTLTCVGSIFHILMQLSWMFSSVPLLSHTDMTVACSRCSVTVVIADVIISVLTVLIVCLPVIYHSWYVHLYSFFILLHPFILYGLPYLGDLLIEGSLPSLSQIHLSIHYRRSLDIPCLSISLIPCLRSTLCSTTLAIPLSTIDIPPLFYYVLLLHIFQLCEGFILFPYFTFIRCRLLKKKNLVLRSYHPLLHRHYHHQV